MKRGCHWQQVVSAICLNNQKVMLVTKEEVVITNSLKLVHIPAHLEIQLDRGTQLFFHLKTDCSYSYLLLDLLLLKLFHQSMPTRKPLSHVTSQELPVLLIFRFHVSF